MEFVRQYAAKGFKVIAAVRDVTTMPAIEGVLTYKIDATSLTDAHIVKLLPNHSFTSHVHVTLGRWRAQGLGHPNRRFDRQCGREPLSIVPHRYSTRHFRPDLQDKCARPPDPLSGHETVDEVSCKVYRDHLWIRYHQSQDGGRQGGLWNDQSSDQLYGKYRSHLNDH